MEKSFFAKILYNYPVRFVRDIPAFALARLAIGIAFIAGESKNVSDLSVSICQRAMDQILSFFLAFDKF
jgi:hypothetical protein